MPKVTSLDCSAFHATPETVRSKLDEFGVAIIPSVLSENQCTLIIVIF